MAKSTRWTVTVTHQLGRYEADTALQGSHMQREFTGWPTALAAFDIACIGAGMCPMNVAVFGKRRVAYSSANRGVTVELRKVM